MTLILVQIGKVAQGGLNPFVGSKLIKCSLSPISWWNYGRRSQFIKELVVDVLELFTHIEDFGLLDDDGGGTGAGEAHYLIGTFQIICTISHHRTLFL